ncbi:hypothetical protein ASPWEDRAFT_170176 [Aspergillus wentii DTO 134E9]|uniref:HNH domain-containing protein n=1 Tax=Aspergillus wentii DTO 134E9 TaxID=1073089 RepID=A0A1L9RP22_ASPWE|nr:uncharacterized protein ASPWEDRAFT_170176 [Aspergillus wentii DTO 134E9]KAI9934198.1 hypothetical protein MW887_005272 [Aspergillus wentii]OJJ36664.1 hypothetical protein ASPWEDRAFT_170176 [Aspergillus wentii DTO 134E9]
MNAHGNHETNYEVFRECLSSCIVDKFNEKPPKTSKRKAHKAKRNTVKKDGAVKNNTPEPSPPIPPPSSSSSSSLSVRANPEDLAEFIDFIASETFPSLPSDLQSLSYSAVQHDPHLSNRYPSPLPRSLIDTITGTTPVSVSESLSVYGLVPDASDLPEFLSPVLNEYITGVTTGPPAWASTRTDACEICERDWIPLSYHHLIPRGVHAKVAKRGWHDEWMLNSVAWLCRACHSFVHRMAGNEELAREWYTVEKILEREDVQDWAKWVGRVRWKAT